MKNATPIALLFVITALLLTARHAKTQEVEYCFDRTTYPPKVVVIPAGTQCPPGYYK